MRNWPGAILGITAVGVLSGLIGLGAATGTASAQVPSVRDGYRRPAEIPFPASNPYTPEKAALGKALFFEPRLSGAENMTCSSCHNPSFGWKARTETSVGAQNTRLPRHAPTVLDTAWVGPFFWDGRAPTAEEQAKGPIQAPAEMNLPLDQAVARLRAVPDYRARFERIFPGHGVDNRFHDIGTTRSDLGRGVLEPDNVLAQYAFKTPSLRDTAQRSPYMHNGMFASLDTVVAHYVGGGIERPSRSPLMHPVSLNPSEFRDLVTFLGTLTGAKQAVTLPVLPN